MKKLCLILFFGFIFWGTQLCANAEITLLNQNFDACTNINELTSWSLPAQAELATDKNGGKALKLNLAEDIEQIYAAYSLANTINSGSVKISYSVRPGAGISTQLTLYDSIMGNDFCTLFMDKSGVFSSGLGWTGDTRYDFENRFELDKWYDVEVVLNLDTGAAGVTVTNEAGVVYKANNDRLRHDDVEISGIQNIRFTIWSKTDSSSYLDNVKIVRMPAAVTVTDIADGNVCTESAKGNVIIHNYTASNAEAKIEWNIYNSEGDIVSVGTEKAIISANSNKVITISLDVGKNGVYDAEIKTKVTGKERGKEYEITDNKRINYSQIVSGENNSEYIGTCYSFLGGNHEKAMKLLDAGGYSGTRFAIYWWDVEKQKNEYTIGANYLDNIDRMLNAGMEATICLMGHNSLYFDSLPESGIYMPETDAQIAAYAAWCGWMARTLKGKVKYFEIWNEPSVPGFNMNSVDGYTYAKIVKAAYEAIKHENSEAVVIALGGGGYNYLESTLKSGLKDVFYGQRPKLLDYCDAISIHPYDKSNDGEILFPETWLSDIKAFKDLIAKYGSKPLWITEFGWATYDMDNSEDDNHDPVTWEIQAQRLVKACTLLKAYGYVDRVYIYCLMDEGNDNWQAEHRWGLMTNYMSSIDGGYHAKNAFVAIAALNHFMAEGFKYYDSIIKNNSNMSAAYCFTNNNGENTAMIWSEDGESFTIDLGCNSIDIYDMYGSKISSMKNQSGIYVFSGSDSPIYVKGNFTSFKEKMIDLDVSECKYEPDKNIVSVRGNAYGVSNFEIELCQNGNVIETFGVTMKKDGSYYSMFNLPEDGEYQIKIGRIALEKIGINEYPIREIVAKKTVISEYESTFSEGVAVTVDADNRIVTISGNIVGASPNEKCTVMVVEQGVTFEGLGIENTIYIGETTAADGRYLHTFKISESKINNVYDVYIGAENADVGGKELYSYGMFKATSFKIENKDMIAVTATFTNPTEHKKIGNILIAQYDKDGKLIEINTKEIQIYAKSNLYESFEAEKAEGAELYSAFLWDSATAMKPITNKISIQQ